MVVGGSGNTFYAINFLDKSFSKLDIGFKGHSFTQNPTNPNEVIIAEKTRDSWCVVDIKRNIIARDYRKSDFIYYGHFAFSPDGQKMFVPKRDKNSKQFFIDVLSTKNYEVVESIPFLELSGMHDVHYKSYTHELIITAVGLLNSQGQKVNGVLVYDLMTKKINHKIQTNFSNALPTHLLNIGPNEYLVSMEAPGGQEEELGLSKSNDVYDYYTGVMHFKSDASTEASLIVLNDQRKNELKGNITNMAFNQNTQTIYLGNVESKHSLYSIFRTCRARE